MTITTMTSVAVLYEIETCMPQNKSTGKQSKSKQAELEIK